MIYFYRTIKEGGVPVSRLYKYDFITNKLDALEGYDLRIENGKEYHVMFAQKFGYQAELRKPEGGWQIGPKEEGEKKLS